MLGMMRPAYRMVAARQRREVFNSTIPWRCYASTSQSTASASRLSVKARPPVSKQQDKSKQHDGSQQSQGPKPKISRWKRFQGWRRASALRSGLFWFFFYTPVVGCVLHVVPLYSQTVTGPSMAPTINPECTSSQDIGYTKAKLIVEKYAGIGSITSRAAKGEKVSGKYVRGDIVMFKTPHDPTILAVKRIVGIAGDVVTPLPGGDQEEVVIPYNHVWVEGDAADRKKSQDSNAYGPLSQEMIQGRVKAILPAWNPWTWTKASTVSKTWPAREQNRVRESAVQEAANNPDHIAKFHEIEGGAGRDVLMLLKRQSEKLKHRFMTNHEYSVQVKEFWTYSKAAARAHHDPASKAQAKEIVDQIEEVFGRDAIRQVSTDWKKGRRKRGSLEQFDSDSELDATLDRRRMVEGSPSRV